MCSDIIRSSFLQLIEREGTSEQDCQDFLEKNTEFFYKPFLLNHGVHFKSIITKFPLDTSLVTDFVYLTKSSNCWHCVLVELEHPKHNLFINKNGDITPSAALTAGIAQIHSWKDFIRKNSIEVVRRLNPLRNSLRDNKIFFKYLLVIGRQRQENSKIQDRLLTLGSGNFQICTYDSLINFYDNNRKEKKNILSLSKDKYCFKYLHVIPHNFLSWLGPDVIKLSKEVQEKLLSNGYTVKDIERWKQGNYSDDRFHREIKQAIDKAGEVKGNYEP